MADMEYSQEDRRAWQQGKVLLFLFVGALSGILLYIGYYEMTHGEPIGYLAVVASAVFWWPLFRLGSYHARKRRPP
jgi:hypothetical protein